MSNRQSLRSSLSLLDDVLRIVLVTNKYSEQLTIREFDDTMINSLYRISQILCNPKTSVDRRWKRIGQAPSEVLLLETDSFRLDLLEHSIEVSLSGCFDLENKTFISSSNSRLEVYIRKIGCTGTYLRLDPYFRSEPLTTKVARPIWNMYCVAKISQGPIPKTKGVTIGGW